MTKKCHVCKFNGEEFNGEAIPRYDGGYDGGGTFVGICEKGQTQHYQDGGDNCKKFKEIELRCTGCKKVSPMTNLCEGFCSEECKETFLGNVKKYVERDEKRLAEIKQEIALLDPIKNEGKLLSLQGELHGVEHYLEEGKGILKSFNISRENNEGIE